MKDKEIMDYIQSLSRQIRAVEEKLLLRIETMESKQKETFKGGEMTKKNIDPSIIRVGSIIKYHGSLWVAIGDEDFVWCDVFAGNIISLHGWFFRKSDLPCPPSEIDHENLKRRYAIHSLLQEKKDRMNWSPFFTCFVEGTNGGLHVQHHNRGIAKIEAERLSGLSYNLGKKVYVMKAVAYCKSTKPEVIWND